MAPILSILIAATWALWAPAPADPPAPHSCCSSTATAEAAAPRATESEFVTPWLAPEERRSISALTGACVNQSGASVDLGALRGKPLLIAFAYTRCTNPNKCMLTTRRVGEFHRRLADAGLAGRVTQLIISYDPDYDTPQRLTDFAAAQGVAPDESLMLLRVDRATLEKLARELGLAVTYNAFGVNLHRLECVLVDSQGRFVRNHHTLIWNDDALLADVRRLLDEEAPQTARTAPPTRQP